MYDGAIGLEEAPRNIEGNVAAINYAAQGQQEAGNHFFAIIRDEDLIAEQLHRTLGDIDVGLEFREVENAVDDKGIVGIQMHPEQGVFLVGIQIAVELQIVFIRQFARGRFPGCFLLVDLFRFGGGFFGDHLQLDRVGHEVAVGLDQRAQTIFF